MIKFFLLLFSFSLLQAGELESNALKAKEKWGLAWAVRSASVPYVTTQNDNFQNSYIPLFYLDTPYFYLDGNEGGFRLIKDSDFKLSLLARHHFVDMPRHDEYFFSEDSIDMGLQLQYMFDERVTLSSEFLTDPAWRKRINLRASFVYDRHSWALKNYLQASYKSSEYNSFYYGLSSQGNAPIDSGVMLSAGVKSRYYMSHSWYLLANAEVTQLDEASRHAKPIKSSLQTEIMLGLGFSQKHHATPKTKPLKGYMRLAFGEATPSSFTENITAQGSRDLKHNTMVSFFYGYPLEEALFGSSVKVYFSPGFVQHLQSSVQEATQEYVMSFKFYYQPKGWWLRFGGGSGLSYISDITYIEKHNLIKDGYNNESHLMHFLDLSCDIELRHIFGNNYKGLWFGYGLHHRSGVFEAAKHFGNIKGGSNYNTLYLQYDFTH